MRKTAIAFMVLVGLAQAVLPGRCSDDIAAPTTPVNDRRIVDIKVEGNVIVPTSEILGRIKTKPGDKFDREAITRDLQAINDTNQFSNLLACPTLCGDGILVTFKVYELKVRDWNYFHQVNQMSLMNGLSTKGSFRDANFTIKSSPVFRSNRPWPRQVAVVPRTRLSIGDTMVDPPSNKFQKCEQSDIDSFLKGKTDSLSGYDLE